MRYVICEAKIVGGWGEEDKIVGSNVCPQIYRQRRKSRTAGQMEIKIHILLKIPKHGMENFCMEGSFGGQNLIPEDLSNVAKLRGTSTQGGPTAQIKVPQPLLRQNKDK
jgi:hypothetical protein